MRHYDNSTKMGGTLPFRDGSFPNCLLNTRFVHGLLQDELIRSTSN